MIPSLSVLANKSTTPPPPPPPPPPISASISARTVSKTGFSSAAATAIYELNLNGNVYNHAGLNLEVWLDSGVNTDFQSRATAVSGDPVTGTLGTWQALSTTRSWSITASAGGVDDFSGTILVEIRLSASPFTVLTSANITLAANSVSTA